VYWPRRIDTRDGQQSGKLKVALGKVVALAWNSPATYGMYCSVFASWSSVSTRMMLGRGAACVRPASVLAGDTVATPRIKNSNATFLSVVLTSGTLATLASLGTLAWASIFTSLFRGGRALRLLKAAT